MTRSHAKARRREDLRFRKGTDTKRDQLSAEVVGVAYRIHKDLGPGLLETVYEVVFAHELRRRGFAVERQVPIPIRYKGIQFDEGFRADLLVDREILIELKSVEKATPAHKKQVLTYLRMTNLKVGFLINFGEELFKHGVYRIVNGVPDQ